MLGEMVREAISDSELVDAWDQIIFYIFIK